MKSAGKFFVAFTFLATAGLSAPCAELAILRNSFTIRHERHQITDSVTRLYLNEAAGNYVDVPTDEIVGYESLESPTSSISPAPPSAPTLDEVIRTASKRYHLDPDLVQSLIHAESGFDTKAVSSKGALGLMQLMPRTATLLGVDDPMDPAANVEGGTRYLRKLLDLYNQDLIKALAAYNAGPKQVAFYRGVPPYSETRTYIARILTDFSKKKGAPDAARQQSPNFVTRRRQ